LFLVILWKLCLFLCGKMGMCNEVISSYAFLCGNVGMVLGDLIIWFLVYYDDADMERKLVLEKNGTRL
jgi:hypothetical protein